MDILAKSPNDRVTVDYNGIEITFKPATTQESIELETVVKSLQDVSKSSMDKVQGMIEFIRTVVVDIKESSGSMVPSRLQKSLMESFPRRV